MRRKLINTDVRSIEVQSLTGIVREIRSIRDGYHVTNVLDYDEILVLLDNICCQ